MKVKKSTAVIYGAGLVLLLALLIVAVRKYYVANIEESDIFTAVSQCFGSEWEWKAQPKRYQQGSGEEFFASGMEAYGAGDYAGAMALFERALEADSRDPALKGYALYYTNKCMQNINGSGSLDVIERAMEAMGQYPPLSNQYGMIWEMLMSVADQQGYGRAMADLMEDYLEYAELELESWAWVKNCIAMLEYENREYARSIRDFYDVEMMLEKAEVTPEVERKLLYAREYIANIYFMFEDYQAAAEMYGKIIAADNGEGLFNGYGCSLNMASAYLELGDTESARAAVDFLRDNIQRVEVDMAGEVEAAINDLMCNISLAEGEHREAREYLDAAQAYYRDNPGDSYINWESFIRLSSSRYMVAVGEYPQAEELLLDMLGSGEAARNGIDRDVHELLAEIYEETGQAEQLAKIYGIMLEMDDDFTTTIQREYLEFSRYYRDVTRIEEHNSILSRNNTIALLTAGIVFVVMLIVLVFAQHLRTRNVTDQLTGVYNRKKLSQLMRRYGSRGTPPMLGVIMMDIDYFKRYNDTYGHPAGDQVLRQVAGAISGALREKDMVIRYGGEEFLVIAKDVSMETAKDMCRRIRDQISALAIPHSASDAGECVTLSMGICHGKAGTGTLEKMIGVADECLYASKQAGRNRFTAKQLDTNMDGGE